VIDKSQSVDQLSNQKIQAGGDRDHARRLCSLSIMSLLFAARERHRRFAWKEGVMLDETILPYLDSVKAERDSLNLATNPYRT
jgi:hypothetical protein